ncbi:MAG: hypothetical protein K9L22_03120 [Methylococcaceae bacterium]|nr:hypothetical protein [Methylococcaceae bacterium]
MQPLNSLLTATILNIACLAPIYAADIPDHLFWAEELVTYIQPENNTYASQPSLVQWQGYNNASEYSNRSVCATFVTELLKYSYNLSSNDFKTWFGSTSPNSAKYHDAIVAQNQFLALSNIHDISGGDIMAVKYPVGGSVSGHTMLVVNTPIEHTASAPIIANTLQYEVDIIDSSRSGHGRTDTRLMEDGTWNDGVGQGVMRLYTNQSGEIVGYTWSTYSNSSYYDQNTRHLVVGRLN